MASRRTYFVKSGAVTLNSTSMIPVLVGSAPSTADFNLVGLRVASQAVSSPSPQNNGSILGAVYVVTGTLAGGASVTPQQLGGNTLGAKSTWTSASSAAITGLTLGAELWEQPIGTGGGSGWGEWFPDSFEIPCAPSTLIAICYSAAAGYGSGMAFSTTANFAE
jgi:hypothetical protein